MGRTPNWAKGDKLAPGRGGRLRKRNYPVPGGDLLRVPRQNVTDAIDFWCMQALSLGKPLDLRELALNCYMQGFWDAIQGMKYRAEQEDDASGGSA